MVANMVANIGDYNGSIKETTADGRLSLAKFVQNGDIGTFASGSLPDNLDTDRVGTLQTLTNKDFINPLMHCPKPE